MDNRNLLNSKVDTYLHSKNQLKENFNIFLTIEELIAELNLTYERQRMREQLRLSRHRPPLFYQIMKR